MKFLLQLSLFLFSCNLLNAQITLETTTLPEVNDIFKYDAFEDYPDSTSFLENGEDLNWSFDNFDITGSETEVFEDIVGSDLHNSFPQANMLIDLGITLAAAERTTELIEIVGISNVDTGFGNGDPEGVTSFDDTFEYIKRPMSYGDKFEDDFLLPFTISADVIPGLDSIEIPLPGATLDSLRISVLVYKSEEATAWGTMELNGTSHEVLKIEQIDSSSTIIEVGLGIAGTILWIDATDLLGDFGGDMGGGFGGGPQTTTSYKFMAADQKQPLLVFAPEIELDTLGNIISTNVTGALGSNITSSLDEFEDLHQQLIVVPNPVDNELQIISTDHIQSKAVELKIYDVSGKIILNNKNYFYSDKVDVSHFNSGQYFIETTTLETRKSNVIKFNKK